MDDSLNSPNFPVIWYFMAFMQMENIKLVEQLYITELLVSRYIVKRQIGIFKIHLT